MPWQTNSLKDLSYIILKCRKAIIHLLLYNTAVNKLQMLIYLIYCPQNKNHEGLNMHLLFRYPNLATLRDLA